MSVHVVIVHVDTVRHVRGGASKCTPGDAKCVTEILGDKERKLLLLFFLTLGINVPEGGLKKLVKMKRLGMSKIPCGHKRAYYHAEEQR